MRVSKIESNWSPRIRIANWNISVTHWLRRGYYERLQKLNFSNSEASMITFIISAFWHGINPCYYIGFIFFNLFSQMEKFCFKNRNLRKFPKIFFYFGMDYSFALFKGFTNKRILTFILNTREIFIVILVLYFMMMLFPKPRKNVKE